MGRLKGQNIWKCYMRCGRIRGIRVPAMAPALLITRQQRFTIRPMLNNNTLGACYGKAKQKGIGGKSGAEISLQQKEKGARAAAKRAIKLLFIPTIIRITEFFIIWGSLSLRATICGYM